MCSDTGGAMDAAVLDMKRCADLFLFSTTFSSHSLTPIRSQGTPTFPPCRPAQRQRSQTSPVKPQANSAFPPCRPAQRRRPQTPTGKPQANSAFPPCRPAQRQRDNDPKHLPLNHKQTQPLLPTVQRSADGSSNSRAAPPHTTALKSQPVRRVLPVDGLCRRGADSWLAEICVASKILTV